MNVRASLTGLFFVFIPHFVCGVQGENQKKVAREESEEATEPVAGPTLASLQPCNKSYTYDKKAPLYFESGDSVFEFITRFKLEGFYGKNLKLLNNKNQTDRLLIPSRHTIYFYSISD